MESLAGRFFWRAEHKLKDRKFPETSFPKRVDTVVHVHRVVELSRESERTRLM
jgi:hypothetical protein